MGGRGRGEGARRVGWRGQGGRMEGRPEALGNCKRVKFELCFFYYYSMDFNITKYQSILKNLKYI